jgi:hypothetical protein
MEPAGGSRESSAVCHTEVIVVIAADGPRHLGRGESSLLPFKSRTTGRLPNPSLSARGGMRRCARKVVSAQSPPVALRIEMWEAAAVVGLIVGHF